MDRNLYLKMCQKVAVLPTGVGGIKQEVPEELCVYYKQIKYYPCGYMMMFDETDGNAIHVAILHDMNINSICHVDLDKVFSS